MELLNEANATSLDATVGPPCVGVTGCETSGNPVVTNAVIELFGGAALELECELLEDE